MLLLTAATLSLYGQTPTIQDCLGAIPICQPVYREAQAPSGMGNYPDEINSSISCLADERNAIWYTFTVAATGNFGFTLVPNRASDDYDWALYDITNATCAEIRTNPNLLVSCNAAGGGSCDGRTGATGGSQYRIQGAGCGNPNPNLNNGRTAFNALIPVEAGNTYVLCVSNWTGSQYGYEIDFGLSASIGILDTALPEIAEITGPQQCGDSTISVLFSENIQCSSIDAQNFQLTGPGGTYDVRLSSTVCQRGGDYTREFTLITQPPIAALGEFTLTLVNSTNTHVLDLCDNPAETRTYTLTVNQMIDIPVELGKDTALVCVGDVLELQAEQIFTDATYQWQDGSSNPIFTVREAGVYKLQVANACGMGSDSIEITYLNDVPSVELGTDTLLCEGETLRLDVSNDFATYLWQDGSTAAELLLATPGDYVVSVSNACGTVVDSMRVDYSNSFVFDIGEDKVLCEGEPLTLDVTTPGVNYLWQDGSTEPIFTTTTAGRYWVRVFNECFEQSDTIELQYVSLPIVSLGVDTLLCEGETLTLDATNDASTYRWQDGSTAANFLIQNSGTYSVAVTNVCGTVSDSIQVNYSNDFVLNLGGNQVLCEGEELRLDVTTPGANYLWHNGSTEPIFATSDAGRYWVRVFNECFEQSDTIELRYVLPATVFLGQDTTLCEGAILFLNAGSPDFTYEWQDGRNGSSYQITESGTYAVTVTNACGSDSDAIHIDFIPPIKADIGPDTVLCPGQRLLLDASDFNAESYRWQDGSTESKFFATEVGLYTVQITNACGTVTQQVDIRECMRCNVYVPNAFSPNSDGENDEFRPYSDCPLENYTLRIFNRWGEEVFSSTNPMEGWNGSLGNKIAPSAAYIWTLEYTVVEDFKPRNVQEAGDVIILR